MLIEKKHIRKNERWWQRQRVASKRELGNSYGSLPTGTIFDIRRKLRGLEIESEKCSVCGLRLTISHVSYDYLVFAPGFPLV